MSKKNKKHEVDYFNMTPEEQMANAEMFHEVERGEASFLDALNYKVPTAPVAQSDYTRQIERACLGMIEEDTESHYLTEVDNAIKESSENIENFDDDDNDETIENYSDTGYIPYSSIVETETTVIHEETHVVVDKNNDVEQNHSVNTNIISDTQSQLKTDGLAKIQFRYEPIIGKLIISDGLVSTPVSVCHTSSIELDPDMIPDDADSFGQLLSKIFFFIITCKHPAVIMSENTFEIEFSLYDKINFNKFVFFKNNGFVYAYILDDDEADNFYGVADIFQMDNDEILRYAVGSAFAANTMHNIFMYNDQDEVDSVMEARHNVKDLMKLVDNDPDTTYAGHNATGNVLNRMKVTDLQAYLTDVRSILEDLILSDDEIEYDDDNDEDIDDETSEDDDVDVNDFPDIDMTTNTDDIDKMFEEIEPIDNIVEIDNIEITTAESTSSTEVKVPSTPTINNIEKVETNDSDDDMVLPVIHRRQ